MINKLIILFFIISSLSIFNAHSSDQINFDVTEIEILDGGNKIIGKNRGTITADNGITIEANNFEFDKIKNILQAKGNVKIKDEINNLNFSSQNVLYEKNKERIEIKGKAEALIDSHYKFKTEDIVILRKEMIISSDVGAKILDDLNKSKYEIGKFSYSIKEKILKGEKFL